MLRRYLDSCILFYKRSQRRIRRHRVVRGEEVPPRFFADRLLMRRRPLAPRDGGLRLRFDLAIIHFIRGFDLDDELLVGCLDDEVRDEVRT